MSSSTVPAGRHTRTRGGFWRGKTTDRPTAQPASLFPPEQEAPRPPRPAPKPEPAPAPLTPHRDKTTDPDAVLLNILLVCHDALVQGWSSTKTAEILRPRIAEIDRRAARELEAAETIRRRAERNLDQAAAMAAALHTAEALGTLDTVDPVAAGRAMAKRSAHAQDPTTQTAVIPVIREGDLAQACTVHVGDKVRVDVDVLVGGEVKGMRPEWRLVTGRTADDDVVMLELADGRSVDFTPDAQVWVQRGDVTASVRLTPVPTVRGLVSATSIPDGGAL